MKPIKRFKPYVFTCSTFNEMPYLLSLHILEYVPIHEIHDSQSFVVLPNGSVRIHHLHGFKFRKSTVKNFRSSKDWCRQMNPNDIIQKIISERFGYFKNDIFRKSFVMFSKFTVVIRNAPSEEVVRNFRPMVLSENQPSLLRLVPLKAKFIHVDRSKVTVPMNLTLSTFFKLHNFSINGNVSLVNLKRMLPIGQRLRFIQLKGFVSENGEKSKALCNVLRNKDMLSLVMEGCTFNTVPEFYDVLSVLRNVHYLAIKDITFKNEILPENNPKLSHLAPLRLNFILSLESFRSQLFESIDLTSVRGMYTSTWNGDKLLSSIPRLISLNKVWITHCGVDNFGDFISGVVEKCAKYVLSIGIQKKETLKQVARCPCNYYGIMKSTDYQETLMKNFAIHSLILGRSFSRFLTKFFKNTENLYLNNCYFEDFQSINMFFSMAKFRRLKFESDSLFPLWQLSHLFYHTKHKLKLTFNFDENINNSYSMNTEMKENVGICELKKIGFEVESFHISEEMMQILFNQLKRCQQLVTLNLQFTLYTSHSKATFSNQLPELLQIKSLEVLRISTNCKLEVGNLKWLQDSRVKVLNIEMMFDDCEEIYEFVKLNCLNVKMFLHSSRCKKFNRRMFR